jgi:hypothetical protein
MSIDLNAILDFFYNNITFEMFIKFVVVYFFVIWISLLVWVVKDISNRTDNILLQFVSILIILFLTPLGIFIYFIIRPGKTFLERCYEEIDHNLDVIAQFVEEHTKVKQQEKRNTRQKKAISK